MDKEAAKKHSADYRARQKEKKAQLGIANITIELAKGVADQLPDFLNLHGFDNAQELYQTLVLYVLRAPDEEAARILKPHTSGFVVSDELTRKLKAAGLAEVDPDEDDESVEHVAQG